MSVVGQLVDEATRCSNDNMWDFVKLLALAHHVGTTCDYSDPQVKVGTSKYFELLSDLES